MTLTAGHFGQFFQAVYGLEPFAWQRELAARVLDRGWPDGVDVPTGLGKTALIDIAVFALAAQAGWDADRRTAPTRTFAVVDRRLVVDQTFDRAQKLAVALAQAQAGVLAEVAEALRSLCGGSAGPLEVVRMRGGVTWSARWLASPDQPAIVVGTVDQFGSRLLFRGYGVGARLRPIDAALCGCDALLILDEAHIARPLALTATSVHRYESASEEPVLAARRPRPVLVSATLPSGLESVFRPDLAAETSEVARSRLAARKMTTLVELASRSKDPVPDLARALVRLAVGAFEDQAVRRVAVVCNTVRVAREVFSALQGAAGLPTDIDSCLLIGRCRPWERERNAEDWGPRLLAGQRPGPRPILAVATQTIEVGADFDFDALVTEAAPLDALLQRLGRLNRFGSRPGAQAVTVYCPGRHNPDPVYGAATIRTWEWLAAQGPVPEPCTLTGVAEARRGGPQLDLSAIQVRKLAGPELRETLSTEAALAPVIIGPTLASWARTEPAPAPDQPVAPFLHGVTAGVPEVQVCWRAGLPEGRGEGAEHEWDYELETTPIADAECVAVPLWEAERFMSGAAERPAEVADLEGVPEPAAPQPATSGERLPTAWVLSPGGNLEAWVAGRRLSPGVTLVVRAEDGGHDRWGWTGASGEEVPDIAEATRYRERIRLRSGLLRNLFGGDRWAASVDPVLGGDDGRREAAGKLLGEIVVAAGNLTPDAWRSEPRRIAAGLAKRLQAAMDGGSLVKVIVERGCTVAIVQGPGARPDDSVPGPGARPVAPRIGSISPFEGEGDDEDAASSAVGSVVSLDQHLRDVARVSAAVATRLRLPDALVRSLRLVGLSHDLGKADRRFQIMLHRGERLRQEAWGDPIAKSGMDPGDREARRQAQQASGWPLGMRHESISLALVRHLRAEHPGVFGGGDPELVEHLVSTHHGWGRPLLPPVKDPLPETVVASLPGGAGAVSAKSDECLVDWDGPERFERLGARYGWWGLALLESIVRLADMACSEGYERGGTS